MKNENTYSITLFPDDGSALRLVAKLTSIPMKPSENLRLSDDFKGGQKLINLVA